MRDPTAKIERAIEFPSGVSACIKADARHLHTRAIATGPAWKVALILVGDDRMKRVWAGYSNDKRREASEDRLLRAQRNLLTR